MKRRDFVTRSIAAGAAAWLVPGVSEAASAIIPGVSAPRTPAGAPPMTRAWFERRIGSAVTLEKDGAEPVRATITAVKHRPTRKAGRRAPALDQFSVVFALKTAVRIDGTCLMRTASDGAHELFVTSVDERGHALHAHFSLLA